MNRLQLILLIFASLFLSEAYGKSTTNRRDSLIAIINQNSLTDSLLIDSYLHLFEEYCYAPDDSCNYISSALSIAEKSSNEALIEAYKKIGDIHRNKKNYQISISFYNQGLRAIKDSSKHGLYADFYHQLIGCYADLRNVKMVMYFMEKNIEESKLNDLLDSYGLGWRYNSFGEVLFGLGKYMKAIAYWEKGAKSFQNHFAQDKKGAYYGMNNSYVNMAMTYSRLQLWDLSTIYMTKCVSIQDSIDNAYSRSWTRYVLASFYKKMGDYTKSDESLLEALENANKILLDTKNGKDFDLIKELSRIKMTVLVTLSDNYAFQKRFSESDSLMNLARLLIESREYDINQGNNFEQTEIRIDFLKGDSLSAIKKCIAILENPNFVSQQYYYAFHYAQYLLKEKDYSKTIEVLVPFIGNIQEMEANFEYEGMYVLLSKAYAGKGRFKEAYELEQKYKVIRDSIHADERSIAMLKTAMEFDYKRQNLHDSLVQANELAIYSDNIKDEKERRKAQEKILYIVSIGLVLVFILGLWAVRNAFLNNKANKLIKKQKEKADEQKLVVEHKNKEIIDSINYAKRIQNALLNSEESILQNLPPHFIFYQPKDIVSGDFYWLLEKGDFIYIAVADCTGHGVPGGFMSMLGISFLNEINAQQQILTPAEILNQLREKIIKELSQENDDISSKDGMDISLLRIKKTSNWDKNAESVDIMWAGANNTLLITNLSNNIQEAKGDRQPIGMHAKMLPFSNHEVTIEKGNMLYMFSDGYPDQFGGKSGKKFKVNQFKKLVQSMSDKSMKQQKEKLDINFVDWKGDLEQTDDICVFGIQI